MQEPTTDSYNWYFIRSFSWSIFVLWTAALAPFIIVIATLRRFFLVRPVISDSGQRLTDWALLAFAATTLATWANVWLTIFTGRRWYPMTAPDSQDSLYGVLNGLIWISGVMGILALITSAILAFRGRGISRKTLLTGQITIAAGGVVGFLFALYEKHMTLGPW